MIEFAEVTKRYGRFGTALERIDLRIERGECVFITGASGAGKSTLLKLLYAAERPTTGDVLVEDRSVSRLHPRSVPYLRRNLGVIFQDFKLLPRRTVFENVALALEVCGVPRRRIRERVAAVLDRVGLGELADRLPGELSGGEQQRAAIARAIVGEPSIVLADEPTGNLDEKLTHDIFGLLMSLNRDEGTTVLVATHDLAEAARWPVRRIVLSGGRVVQDLRVEGGEGESEHEHEHEHEHEVEDEHEHEHEVEDEHEHEHEHEVEDEHEKEVEDEHENEHENEDEVEDEDDATVREEPS